MKRFWAHILLLLLPLQAVLAAPPVKISGRVVERNSELPVPGAIVRLDDNYLWAVTGDDGTFVMEGAQPGKYKMEVACLGYITWSQTLDAGKSIPDLTVILSQESLALNEVVVTAEKSRDNLNTTQKIGRTALDHLQMNSMGGIAALLPGGKTVNPDLTTENTLSLRSGGQSVGNAAFSTAVEVNGVRMGDNASFGAMSGVGTRSLSVENIESIEVITGVPSAEYGDLGSGMIRVNTKKGRSPLSVVLSVNPRTYEASVSKGIELGQGVLNIGGEWARATKNLVSPYASYTRRGFTLDYTRTFHKKLRLEAGLNGNVGGMNTESDPDSFKDTYTRENDNLLTPHLKLVWLLNRGWITNLELDASVYYHDKRIRDHQYQSQGSTLPAVHAEQQGYWIATRLPHTYYTDQITDSRELDYAASLKYNWLRHWGGIKNSIKAGLQWKADGNVGQGEYYLDASLAANGYRPRPYSGYPYMHTLAAFAEDKLAIPVGPTTLNLMAGLRWETVMVKGTQYKDLSILSPRLNAKWSLGKYLDIRGGWGIAGKLPSFYILYPRQEYRDILTFSVSAGDQSTYVYYTIPYTLQYNPELQWQRNYNSEVGVDAHFLSTKLSLVGFYNKTKGPYEMGTRYTPFSYRVMTKPDGYEAPENPEVTVDRATGDIQLTDINGNRVNAKQVTVDRTFVATRRQQNGADVHRCGLELTADFPEILPLSTQLRLDAAWNRTWYSADNTVYYYPSGVKHTTVSTRSYQYVGIYEGAADVVNGVRTDQVNANLTAITHIPRARLVVTVRVEATLLRNSQNTSTRAFTTTESGRTDTGGNIYGGNSFTAVYPTHYMDTEGNIREFKNVQDLSWLVMHSSTAYTFALQGYDPYLSANVSVTKELGKHVSMSFFANNFTNSRPFVKNRVTGQSVIFTPDFYYGLTCRIKL